MEGRKLSKSVPSSNANNAGRSLSRSRIKCQLCATPVAFTTDVNGTSGDEIAFTASLERLHGFLVRFNFLEDGDEGLLSCSATEICGKCKSNLKFAMKHMERAVQQHEKVKGIYEEFTDELQTLQGETGAATFRLQEVVGGAGISQGELQCAIGKAFNNFQYLQDSTKEILECLKSKYNQNSGLFPFLNIEAQDENGGGSQDLSDQQDPLQIDEVVKLEDNSRTGEDGEQSDGNENERSIATDRDQQDLQQTEQVTKVESETGTGGEASDMDENEQNVDPRITCVYSIAGCYVVEDIAENGCSPAVKVEPSSDGSDLADNLVPVVSLESSKTITTSTKKLKQPTKKSRLDVDKDDADDGTNTSGSMPPPLCPPVRPKRGRPRKNEDIPATTTEASRRSARTRTQSSYVDDGELPGPSMQPTTRTLSGASQKSIGKDKETLQAPTSKQRKEFGYYKRFLSGTDYVCPICESKHKKAYNLEQHMKTHEEPGYECPHEGCPYSTNVERYLRQHLPTHNVGAQPYVCPHADCPSRRNEPERGFTRAATLRNHLQKIHGEKSVKKGTKKNKRREEEEDSSEYSEYSDEPDSPPEDEQESDEN